MIPSPARFVPALLLLVPPAVADVLVVGGAGADHPDIQSAIDAAAEGDTILVRSGTYAGCGIYGKSVSVVADAGASVVLTTEIAVRNLLPGQQVDLVGLTVQGAPPDNRGLVAAFNAGVIWVEECDLRGTEATPLPFFDLNPAQPGIFALDTDDLILVRCSVEGGTGWSMFEESFEPYASAGAHGIVAASSSLSIFEGEVLGGYGGGNYDTVSADGGRGGDGLNLGAGSFAFLDGVAITGRNGGSADESLLWGCGDGGAGGHGLVSPSTADAFYRDCTLTGGQGGAPGGFSCSWGPDGLPLAPFDSDAVALPGTTRLLAIESPVASGATALLEAHGAPGERLWVQVAPDLDPAYLPVLSSMRLIGLPRRLLFIGTLDGSGQLQVPLTMPVLPPTGSYAVHVQGYFQEPGGVGAVLGSAAHLLVLGSAY